MGIRVRLGGRKRRKEQLLERSSWGPGYVWGAGSGEKTPVGMSGGDLQQSSCGEGQRGIGENSSIPTNDARENNVLLHTAGPLLPLSSSAGHTVVEYFITTEIAHWISLLVIGPVGSAITFPNLREKKGTALSNVAGEFGNTSTSARVIFSPGVRGRAPSAPPQAFSPATCPATTHFSPATTLCSSSPHSS